MKKIMSAMGLLLCLHSAGSNALQGYTELNVAGHLSDIGSEDFTTGNLELRLGCYVQQGVGVEVFGSGPVTDDDSLDLAAEIGYTAGAAMRFQSPERDGTSVFFLLGYAVSELSLDRSGTGKPGSDEFDGFTYGGGIEFRPGKQKNWFLNLKMQRYYSDAEIDLDLASVGVRYQF